MLQLDQCPSCCEVFTRRRPDKLASVPAWIIAMLVKCPGILDDYPDLETAITTWLLTEKPTEWDDEIAAVEKALNLAVGNVRDDGRTETSKDG